MEGIASAATFNGGLSQHYSCFLQKPNLRDASFSSYLSPKQASSTQEHNEYIEDSEISIFDARKYFNEGQEQNDATNKSRNNLPTIVEARRSSFSSIDGFSRNYRTRSFHATPTASSEASWNSQTGLLSIPPGSVAVSLRNPTLTADKKRGSNWFFGRKCPCAGKKSVQVEENVSQPQTPSRSNDSDLKCSIGNIIQKAPQKLEHSAGSVISPVNHSIAVNSSRRVFGEGAGFSFPILNASTPVKKIVPKATKEDDPPRESLDVFRQPDEYRDRRFTFPASPKSRMTAIDDDVASDASSDLFEIESFSTQTTSYPMYHRRDSLDDDVSSFNPRRMYGRRSLDGSMTPSIAPTECYEPSEASIDWSVTTAEGFDRGSLTNFSISASEFGVRGGGDCVVGGGGGGGGESKRRVNGGLLSCRWEKAVNVGPHPVRCGIEGVQDLSALMHVSGRPPQPPKTGHKPPLGRSHSDRLSLAFAT